MTKQKNKAHAKREEAERMMTATDEINNFLTKNVPGKPLYSPAQHWFEAAEATATINYVKGERSKKKRNERKARAKMAQFMGAEPKRKSRPPQGPVKKTGKSYDESGSQLNKEDWDEL